MGPSTKPFLLLLLLSVCSAESVSEALINTGQEINSCELMLAKCWGIQSSTFSGYGSFHYAALLTYRVFTLPISQ